MALWVSGKPWVKFFRKQNINDAGFIRLPMCSISFRRSFSPGQTGITWDLDGTTRKDAYNAFDIALPTYSAKYPKAMKCLKKDKDEMLAFHDPLAVYWQHIRTSNPIESTFATVRLRTTKTRWCVARHTILSMVWKLGQNAQKKWRSEVVVLYDFMCSG